MRHGYTTQNEKAMVFIKLWHYIFRPEKTQGFPPFSDPKIGKTLSSPPKIGEDGLTIGKHVFSDIAQKRCRVCPETPKS